MDAQPNIQFKGARIAQCVIDPDSGVISEATPRGRPPQFIEIGFKDSNVLKIYADGTHSDDGEFKFVDYIAPSNWPARRWLFEQFFEQEYPRFWHVFRVVRWYCRKRRKLLIWWLNKREKDPNVTWF